MRSYLLGIVVAIVLSAAYAFSNTGEISVRFLSLERYFPQGLWEIILFASGALMMWFFSVAASFELYSANKKKTREMQKKITDLENEKKSLLTTLQHIGENTGLHNAVPEKTVEQGFEPEKIKPDGDKRPDEGIQSVPEAENKKIKESTPSFLKNVFGSFFSGSEKTEMDEGAQNLDSPETAGENASEAAVCHETAKIGESDVLHKEKNEEEEPFTI
jgi:uncharacterized integral membrane protein